MEKERQRYETKMQRMGQRADKVEQLGEREAARQKKAAEEQGSE